MILNHTFIGESTFCNQLRYNVLIVHYYPTIAYRYIQINKIKNPSVIPSFYSPLWNVMATGRHSVGYPLDSSLGRVQPYKKKCYFIADLLDRFDQRNIAPRCQRRLKCKINSSTISS